MSIDREIESCRLLLLTRLQIIHQHPRQNPCNKRESGRLEWEDIAGLHDKEQHEDNDGHAEAPDGGFAAHFLFVGALCRGAGCRVSGFVKLAARVGIIERKEHDGEPQAEQQVAREVGQQGAHGQADQGTVDVVLAVGHGGIISLGYSIPKTLF